MEKFNFDEWAELAKSDPKLFERRRREAVEKMINGSAPHRRQRLRGLQWRIDVVRRKYRDPRVSAHRLFSMMWESVYGQNGLLDALHLQALPEVAREPQPATVLEFRQR